MSFIDQALSTDVFISAIRPLQQSLGSRLTKQMSYPIAFNQIKLEYSTLVFTLEQPAYRSKLSNYRQQLLLLLLY